MLKTTSEDTTLLETIFEKSTLLETTLQDTTMPETFFESISLLVTTFEDITLPGMTPEVTIVSDTTTDTFLNNITDEIESTLVLSFSSETIVETSLGNINFDINSTDETMSFESTYMTASITVSTFQSTVALQMISRNCL